MQDPVPKPADAAAPEEAEAADGMRREWNFTFHLHHQAARASVLMIPAWTCQFIDPDEIIKLNKLDRDVRHCPMMPFASYVDSTIAVQTGAFWEECPKSVKLMYSHVPHGTSLSSYCKRSVQHILTDPRVESVDGQLELKKLTVGKKMVDAPKIGGRNCFHFNFIVVDKIRSRAEYVYAIGTIAGQRGYLITVTCNKEAELQGYIKNHFLPHFKDATKFAVDFDVQYEEVNNNVLKEQQELYGELHYYDRDAAVSFALPMHPARLRPDFSPIQSVGVGSIACMTLELEVNQKLMDDFAEADITGMPKYKVNNVLLFIEAEDVARMGYQGIMSIEQYSAAKLKRLMEVFKDAKTVGTPITLMLGQRCGRSATVTFTYDGLGGIVKAMLVSTLVGNMGITVLYFTKLGGGLFDAHLYIYQQLLKSVTFRAPKEQTERFSRYQAVQIRLSDQDLPRCYAAAPVSERKTMERHAKALQASTDGKTEGARYVFVEPSRGGVVRQGGALASQSEGVEGAAPVEVLPVAVEENTTDVADDLSEISTSSIPHLAHISAWDASDEAAPSPPARGRPSDTSSTKQSEVAVGDGTVAQAEGDDKGTTALSSTQPQQRSPRPQALATVEEETTSTNASPKSGKSSGQQSQQTAAASTSATDAVESDKAKQQQLIRDILKEDEEMYLGPSLHDVYMHCCELQHCRPNSYLLKKLPTSPRFTMSVEELDLTSNYLGHNGFVAVLNLLEHLPKLHSVFFNDMSLDNSDIENMCDVLTTMNTSVRSIHLRNNTKITLPATKHLTKLLKANPKITSIALQGTRIGPSLIAGLEELANKNKESAGTPPKTSPRQRVEGKAGNDAPPV